MPIGVESAHGFGDLTFNLSLIKAIRTKYNGEIWVAVRPHCKDALFNIPWVDKIIEIPHMWHGIPKLKEMGCDPVFQITQNVKFFEFRSTNPQHSLIDTPLFTGKQLGIHEFNQRPVFRPTASEISKANNVVSSRPTIGIESVFNSAQSWARQPAFDAILQQYLPTHRVLWLSNANAPKHENVDNLLRFSRREVIMCLRACDIFFSVGSGFFCAALALPAEFQPKKIVCLWTDNLYKYENPLNKHQWHPNITWVHNMTELTQCLQKLQPS